MNKYSYGIIFLDEDGKEQSDYSYSEQIHEWKLLAFKQYGYTIIKEGTIKELEEAEYVQQGN